MRFKVFKNTVLFLVLVVLSCGSKSKESTIEHQAIANDLLSTSKTNEHPDLIITVGANSIPEYLPLLKNKRVGIVANQTSVIFKQYPNEYVHLVDSLLNLNVSIKAVFAPEHGFRGTADAGELVKDGIDLKTGLPIISLYGKNKKPNPKQLEGIDIMIFDIQDVGARFYTYISSLHYVMEACAEQGIPVLILDRPNPNGHYIDGPVLEKEHQSFVGMHPVPVVHGMTIGEYAQMINGEGWMENEAQCELTIIPVKNYTHNTLYSLPIKPSPNLPNDQAINLYPSLCFFEGTSISIGRGTDKQFQIVGAPFYSLKKHSYSFTPQPNEGAKYPKHEGKVCYGYDLSQHQRLNTLNLSWLIEFYNINESAEAPFFKAFFTKLAGTKLLQEQIEANWSEQKIKASWHDGLETYKKIRDQYLIYKD